MEQEVYVDFLDCLDDLSVNSRPIIKTLTEIAQENAPFAKSVTNALADHILRTAPAKKLPALYLLDSIAKNVGEVYVPLITPRIFELFTTSFAASPEPIKVKLSDMFKTWTAPSPQRQEPVFPHAVLRQLNDYMLRQSQKKAPPASLAPPVGRQRLTQSALMVEINRFRQLLEQDDGSDFNDKQKSLLDRIEASITGVVDPKTLPSVQDELDAMKQARENHRSRAPQKRNRNRGGGHNKRVNSGGRGAFGHEAHDEDPYANDEMFPNSSRPTRDALGGTGTGDLAAPMVYVDKPALISELTLATAATAEVNPALIEMLYSDLPLQCPTCGFRFPDTPEGKKMEVAEMDWHFRCNKDIRENHSRNRLYYLTLEQWVVYKDEDEMLGADAGAGDTPAAEEQIDYESLKLKHVEVSSDEDQVCPVCQEIIASAWSEDAENWVWMNCVEKDGKLFHATCFADPANADLVASICG